MDGLTTVPVVSAPTRTRKQSATTFMHTWTVSAVQAQEEQISLTPLRVQCLMAKANQWVTLMSTVETETFWEPRRETFRPITCHHRRAEILSQVKLPPATATTAHSQWTSSVAE